MKIVLKKQPQRYVEAIEKFISLYGDQEIEIYSTQEEVK